MTKFRAAICKKICLICRIAWINNFGEEKRPTDGCWVLFFFFGFKVAWIFIFGKDPSERCRYFIQNIFPKYTRELFDQYIQRVSFLIKHFDNISHTYVLINDCCLMRDLCGDVRQIFLQFKIVFIDPKRIMFDEGAMFIYWGFSDGWYHGLP